MRPSLIRSLILWFTSLVIISIMVWFGLASHPDFVGTYTQDGRTYRVRIPGNFIFMMDRDHSKRAVLQVWWPGLAVVQGTEHFAQEWRRGRSDLSIMITARRYMKDLAGIYGVEARHAGPLDPASPRMDLQHQESGLRVIGFERRDIYTLRDPELETVISCMKRDDVVVNPMCEAYFYTGPFMTEVSYPASYLSHWHAIQTDVSGALFNCMKTKDEVEK